MANEIIVPIKVETKDATSSVDNLGKSFGNLDKTVGKTQEKQADYAKQILNSSTLSQKLSQATGGLSDSLLGAVKGLDMTNLSLKAMKGAIMSTGVGLLVIALGELITMLADFYSSEKRSEQAVESMNKALEKQNELYDEQSGVLEQSIKVRKLQAEIDGKSAKELVEIERVALKERQALNERYIADKVMEMDKLRKNEEISTEDFQKQQGKLEAELRKGTDKRLELQRGGTIATLENQKKEHEEANKLKEDADAKKKAQREKEKQELEQQKQALKTLEQKYADDIENMSDTTAQKKLDRQKERAFEELEKIKLSEKAKAEAIRLINEDFKLKQEALEKTQDDRLLAMSKQFAKDKEDILAKTEEQKLQLKIDRDKLALETELATMVGDDIAKNELRAQLDEKNSLLTKELAQKRLDEQNALKQEQLIKDSEDETLTFEARLLALQEQDALIDQNTTLTEQQRLDAHKANATAMQKIDEAKYQGQQALIKATSDSLAMASDVIGKQTAVGKTMALASALINTYQGITAGLKLGYPQAIPAVAMASLTGFGAVKNIMSVKTPNAGGGGGSTPNMSAPTQASFNVVGASGANQIAQSIGMQNQQPVKAYVVGGDVTTQQSLNRNIVNNASIG